MLHVGVSTLKVKRCEAEPWGMMGVIDKRREVVRWFKREWDGDFIDFRALSESRHVDYVIIKRGFGVN